MADNSWGQIWSLSQTRRFSGLIGRYWRQSILAQLLGKGWCYLGRRFGNSLPSSPAPSDLGPRSGGKEA